MQKLGLRRGGSVRKSSPRRGPGGERGAGPGRESRRSARQRSAAAVPAPGVVSLRWERRLITILVAALAGPEEVSPLQFAPALEQLIAKLKSFGGRVEELAPDRIVAVFGFEPVEDGPRRAAHAALAMLKALERMEGSLRPAPTGRFGIHVCRCLIAQSGEVAGMDATDRRAAWSALDALIDKASPAASWWTPAVRSSWSGASSWSPWRRTAGPDEAVYRVVGHERSGFEVGGVALSRFVGRPRELAMLRELSEPDRGGRGQAVGILGEPGVGKSRLLYEFRESLEPGRVGYIEGRCLSYGSTIPYLPIIDIVRRSLGVLETDPTDVVAAKVETGLQALGMDPAVSAPYVLHLLGSTGAGGGDRPRPEAIRRSRPARWTCYGRWGSREAASALSSSPSKIAQWIDQTSEEALASLAESLAGCPVMLITTNRPGYRPPWLGRSYASQVGLDRLTPADSLEVVHSVVPEPELAPELAQMIVAHADGVPFFLEELARAVADHPDLSSDFMVPDTIQGVLEARLDRLPEAEKHLLQVASVIGKDVPVSLLQAVAGVPEADLRRRPLAPAGHGVHPSQARVALRGVHLQACADA